MGGHRALRPTTHPTAIPRGGNRRDGERRGEARKTDGGTASSNGIPTERKPKGHRKRSKRTAFVSAGKHQKTGAIIQSDSDKR